VGELKKTNHNIIGIFFSFLFYITQYLSFWRTMEEAHTQKLFAAAELLFPAILHIFDLSTVELLINGRAKYKISSDFSSILFYMSMSMIFSYVRKKRKIDVIKMPLKIVGMVSAGDSLFIE
jgi:hypothetical protein